MPKATLNGIEIAHEVYGEGFPLVLVHYSSGSKEMWADQIGPFSEKYRVVVYDVRGHGESEAPPDDDPRYTMENLVEDQRALLAYLGIERAFVLGISIGGAIALQFALAHPEMTAALLLCDTTADMSHTASEQYHRAETDHEAVKAYLAKKGLAARSQHTWLDWARPLGIVRPAELPAGAQRHIARVEQMSIEGYLGSGKALRNHSVLDRLHEISAPVLIVTGDHDFLRSASERMCERLPEARFVVIWDAAHITSFWQPEKFTSAVLDFLADVDAGRPIEGSEER